MCLTINVVHFRLDFGEVTLAAFELLGEENPTDECAGDRGEGENDS